MSDQNELDSLAKQYPEIAALIAERNMYREDMRVLALRALEEATGALTQPSAIIAGVFQGKMNRAARLL